MLVFMVVGTLFIVIMMQIIYIICPIGLKWVPGTDSLSLIINSNFESRIHLLSLHCNILYVCRINTILLATRVTMRRRAWETHFERVGETPTAMLVPYCRNSSLEERISKACPWPSFTCVPPADGF